MKLSLKKISYLLTMVSSGLIAQISGNQVYGTNSYTSNNSGYSNYAAMANQTKIVSTAQTLTINAKLLLNKQADYYLITIGTNEESKTVEECNTLINNRIGKFTKGIKKFGVEKDDLYVDFISQTQVYDYEVGQNEAEQYFTGYEIKKNIILKLKNIDFIDQMIELAAAVEIYDIIKVEYIDIDIDKSYTELYAEAMQLIELRKDLFIGASGMKLNGKSRMVSNNFYAIAPKMQYLQYTAAESSNLSILNSSYSQNYVSKEARKHKTYYYNGIETGSFDRIINADMVKVGLQYVFEISFVYGVFD